MADPNFPEEIWFIILGFLPLKSLLWSQQVSKTWKHMISNFLTTRGHVSMSASLLVNLIHTQEVNSTRSHITLSWLDLKSDDYQSDPNGYQIQAHRHYILDSQFQHIPSPVPIDNLSFLSCSGGLFLLQATNGRYYVFNPITRQSTSLPQSPSPPGSYSLGCAVLAVEPVPTSKKAGSAKVTCHYKVVCLLKLISARHNRMEVFCSRTGKWSQFKVNDILDSRLKPLCRGLYLNGTLFIHDWFSYTIIAIIIAGNDEDINQVKSLRYPKSASFRNVSVDLGISDGSLYLSCFHRYGKTNNGLIIVFRFEGDLSCKKPSNHDWITVLEIDIVDMCCNYFKTEKRAFVKRWLDCNWLKPAGFHPNEPAMFLHSPNHIFLFHLTTRKLSKFAKLENTNPNKVTMSVMRMSPFTPCLASICDSQC